MATVDLHIHTIHSDGSRCRFGFRTNLFIARSTSLVVKNRHETIDFKARDNIMSRVPRLAVPCQKI